MGNVEWTARIKNGINVAGLVQRILSCMHCCRMSLGNCMGTGRCKKNVSRSKRYCCLHALLPLRPSNWPIHMLITLWLVLYFRFQDLIVCTCLLIMCSFDTSFWNVGILVCKM